MRRTASAFLAMFLFALGAIAGHALPARAQLLSAGGGGNDPLLGSLGAAPSSGSNPYTPLTMVGSGPVKRCMDCAPYQTPDPVNQCIRAQVGGTGCYGSCDARGFCTCYPTGWCDPFAL